MLDRVFLEVVDYTCLQNHRHGADRVARREVDRVRLARNKKPTWLNTSQVFGHVGLLANGLPASGSPLIQSPDLCLWKPRLASVLHCTHPTALIRELQRRPGEFAPLGVVGSSRTDGCFDCHG
jgi:hypothetical protein